MGNSSSFLFYTFNNLLQPVTTKHGRGGKWGVVGGVSGQQQPQDIRKGVKDENSINWGAGIDLEDNRHQNMSDSLIIRCNDCY